MKIISIIPARGGSIGIPGKNLRDFCGQPLISWSIQESLKSKSIHRTIVSTDSEDIAKVARDHGAEVPFLRPKNLATSEIAIEPTLRHAVEFLQQTEGFWPDYVCLLLATNPLRNTEIIERCIGEAIEGRYDCVMTVNEIPANHTPFWSLVERKGKVSFYFEQGLESRFARRQDFPEKCYAKNDLIFVFRPENLLLEHPSLYGKGEKVKLVQTPLYYDGDINTPEEWLITESLFRFLRSEEGRKLQPFKGDL